MIKLKNLFCIILLASIILACSNDDERYSRGIPSINSQFIEASEGISDEEIIGMVEAEDPNGDDLTFGLGTDKSGLFEVSSSGEIALIKGKELDFETSEEHQFTVRVTDGKGEFFNYVTVLVLDVDESPTIEDQNFEVSESIAANEVFGTVMATDPEGQVLIYSIIANDGNLFEIDPETGELSIASGMSLDFETAEEHNIIARVSDGVYEAEAQIDIKVTNYNDELAEQLASFVTSWDIPSDNFELIIGANENYSYDFTIDWGDGTVEEINMANSESFTHTYDLADTYIVAIQGDFPAINMANSSQDSRLTLKGINQWGHIAWKTFNRAFYFCANLEEYSAQDIPILNDVTDMNRMFIQATSFNADIGGWDVSNVLDMNSMFYYATSFDGDISDWTPDKVQNMAYMFFGAYAFNQDISGWVIVNVNDMSGMFRLATNFNQDLGGLPISNVSDMSNMFDDSGMTPDSMNATLIGWADFVQQNGAPTNITCGMQGITVCGPEVDVAGAFLVNDNGWSFPGINNVFVCP